MTNQSINNFICELRKSKNLTQKELAEKLNVTDKAVSKWERGLSYPDITLISKLAQIFEITTDELLNGGKNDSNIKEDTVIQNTYQFNYNIAKTKINTISNIIKVLITIVFSLSILICITCDLAITKSLSWSLYPISSIIFAWFIIIPFFHFKNNRIMNSLLSLSIFIIPFLFILSKIIGNQNLLSLGVPISLTSIIYLWIIYSLFNFTKLNRLSVFSIIFTLSIVYKLIINYIIYTLTNQKAIQSWDILIFSIIFIISLVLFGVKFFFKSNTINHYHN